MAMRETDGDFNVNIAWRIDCYKGQTMTEPIRQSRKKKEKKKKVKDPTLLVKAVTYRIKGSGGSDV